MNNTLLYERSDESINQYSRIVFATNYVIAKTSAFYGEIHVEKFHISGPKIIFRYGSAVH